MRRETLPGPVSSWRLAGDFILVDGVRLYFQKQGWRRKGGHKILVCFHGFPTSSWDWHEVLPDLAEECRVLVFDFPGYGLSDKPSSRSYSLLRQMDAVEVLLQSLEINEFDLMTHDMGNSVACELLYRCQQKLTGLRPRRWLMLNGGVYMDLHQPLPTQRLLRTPVLGEITARLSSRWLFDRQFPKVYADPEQFERWHYDCQWALLQHNAGRRVLAKLAGYMKERLKYTQRWLEPLYSTDMPIHLFWGEKDPIAVPAIADRLMGRLRDPSETRLPEIGHYPQLEAPERVVSAALDFFS